MSKKPADKLAAKQAAWIERSARVLAMDTAAVEALLDQARRQSIRLNPLALDPDAALTRLRELGWQGQPYDWAEYCYTIDTGLEAVRDSDLVASGAVYIQNAASWLPVLALDPQPGDNVLDVCAAPGGKTSHIAAVTDNRASITANDNSRPRLAKLQANMNRLGATAERYTLYDATQLARKLGGEQFDKILLDAPCSGEGLMRLSDTKSFETWSVAHIHRLQQLQKRILTQAWQLLRPGGTLIYSTCTMAPEENEAVIDYLLRTHTDAGLVPIDLTLPNRVPTLGAWNDRPFTADLSGCLRLAPSQDIEAFFVAKLHKLPLSE